MYMYIVHVISYVSTCTFICDIWLFGAKGVVVNYVYVHYIYMYINIMCTCTSLSLVVFSPLLLEDNHFSSFAVLSDSS